jgi:hypothetical protein
MIDQSTPGSIGGQGEAIELRSASAPSGPAWHIYGPDLNTGSNSPFGTTGALNFTSYDEGTGALSRVRFEVAMPVAASTLPGGIGATQVAAREPIRVDPPIFRLAAVLPLDFVNTTPGQFTIATSSVTAALGPGGFAAAPVRLPDGATVISLTCAGIGDGAIASVQLWANVVGSNSVQECCYVLLPSSAGRVTCDPTSVCTSRVGEVTPAGFTQDGVQYFVQIYGSSSWGPTTVYTCSVGYTTRTP